VNQARESLLKVRGLAAGYGPMQVVHGIDLDVAAGELACIVGRNGAGKSTTVMAMAGVRQGRFSGSVVLGDVDLSRSSVPSIVAAGLSLVPEGHRVFAEMSVTENLRMGAYGLRRSPSAMNAQFELVYDLFEALRRDRRKPAGNLSGGQQQMVAIGQAIMSRPKVLVLDEPSSGLALGIVDDIYQAIRRLKDENIGLLVVEQNVERALRESDRCYVFEGGQVALEGPSNVLAADDRVNEIVTGVAIVREGEQGLHA
jgi:branched-chain amino acid transport system ATP-binding protein